MNVKGYKPTKKCVKYIKKMITQGTWKLNQKIPTITKISETLNISPITVRNSIRFFERQGTIENYGSLGFFLKLPLKNSNKSIVLLKNLKLNIEAADMLNNGAVQLGVWIVNLNKKSGIISALNIISGIKIVCLYSILENMIKNPITIEYLLSIEDEKTLKDKKLEYYRQAKLIPLARLILRSKKEILKYESNLY